MAEFASAGPTGSATFRLTEYSHGAGCGCKISPEVLSRIIGASGTAAPDPRLLVGNSTRDDAAVFALDDERAIISTTDFFMPIVDDPFAFGGIASVNAISDIYAMGGKPLVAIAILGWPVDKIPAEVAGDVLAGARDACARAGITLAGGHSIDAPEPIFGLAVTGEALRSKIKTNSDAVPGCELYLTKPLGIGILTTAQKRGLLKPADLQRAVEQMLQLNDVGVALAELPGVRAMTDVTGFGLLGHLVEMCEGSGCSAEVFAERVPLMEGLNDYLEAGTVPGGTKRNFESYGGKISELDDSWKTLLCDPQTSGGLLVAVEPATRNEFMDVTQEAGLSLRPVGATVERGNFVVRVG